MSTQTAATASPGVAWPVCAHAAGRDIRTVHRTRHSVHVLCLSVRPLPGGPELLVDLAAGDGGRCRRDWPDLGYPHRRNRSVVRHDHGVGLHRHDQVRGRPGDESLPRDPVRAADLRRLRFFEWLAHYLCEAAAFHRHARNAEHRLRDNPDLLEVANRRRVARRHVVLRQYLQDRRHVGDLRHGSDAPDVSRRLVRAARNSAGKACVRAREQSGSGAVDGHSRAAHARGYLHDRRADLRHRCAAYWLRAPMSATRRRDRRTTWRASRPLCWAEPVCSVDAG